MSQQPATASPEAHEKEFTIHIDKAMFKVSKPEMTGAELRQLPTPPVGDDRDLYLEVPGPGEDKLVEDTEIVKMKHGMHFFTVPRNITPG